MTVSDREIVRVIFVKSDDFYSLEYYWICVTDLTGV